MKEVTETLRIKDDFADQCKRTSPDCVASTAASFCGSFLTISVARKNNTVAITPELSATIKDWNVCPIEGSPSLCQPKAAIKSQNGRLASVMPSTR